MIFWITCGALAILVALVLVRAAFRANGLAEAERNPDLSVYRDQLAEVERDLARGVLSEADAERVRTEVSRRILAADSAAHTAPVAAGKPARAVMLALGVLLVGGAFALYARIGAPGYGDLALSDRIAFAEELRSTRPDQADAVAGMPAFTEPADLSPEYAALLKKLRTTLSDRPDDLQGHILLAQNEAAIGNYTAAAEAQARVVAIKGDAVTAQDLADQGELLVLAAGGYVSPEAEAVLRRVLSLEEQNGTARYYLGLMMIQTGRPDIGFRLWDALLRRGPQDAPWIAPIVAQIGPVANLAGVNYTVPEIGPGAQRGPSSADIDAAASMTPAERMEMIGSMVAGLSDRLAREGGPVEDWARLISSLGVLGQTDRARAIYLNAREVFADDATAMDTIYRAGDQAGVAE